MRISGYGAVSGYGGASAPKQVQGQAAVRPDEKAELKETDPFASSQLPPGVGEKLNIKA